MAISNEEVLPRPETSTFAAGRVFFAMDNTVYYCQTLEGETLTQITKCYQVNDPTAEQFNTPLATDGGEIPINGADRIIKLVEFQNGILVMANNGVWHIYGPDGGFKATDFTVRKITTEGCSSHQSVVQAEGDIYYWSKSGIYVLAQNEFGIVQATNMIFQTIQTFYDSIPSDEKKVAYGVFNAANKTIEWLYANTSTKSNKFLKNKSIIFDLKVGGWFIHQFDSDLNYTSSTEYKTVVGAIPKSQDASETEILYHYIKANVAGTSDLSYGFATRTDTNFQDFGTNYPTAFLETGYETLGKPSNKKQAPYVVTHFRQTEENWIDDGAGGYMLDKQSACQLQSKWDWSNSAANGRWGPQQQAYKFKRVYIPSGLGAFDSGESVITNKLKVMGRGNSLSLRFEQEAGKDFQLLGYSVQYNMKGTM